MSRSPFRLCIRHKNSIKTYCKRHPPKPDGTPRDVQYRPPRHCRTKDCANLLLPKQEYPWRVCEDCRIRKQQAKAMRYGPLWEFLSTRHNPDFSRNSRADQPSELFPCYQDFAGSGHSSFFNEIFVWLDSVSSPQVGSECDAHTVGGVYTGSQWPFRGLW